MILEDFVFVAFIFKYLLNVIEYLHSVKVWHRDITASNILIKEETLVVKVIDFGLTVETNHQTSLLTPRSFKSSRPPEMMFFNEYDEKIDEWIAGIPFLKLVTNDSFLDNKRKSKGKKERVSVYIQNEGVSKIMYGPSVATPKKGLQLLNV